MTTRVLHLKQFLIYSFALLAATFTATPSLASAPTSSVDQQVSQQARSNYQLARTMLEKEDFGAYLTLREELTGYPLYPYLEYDYLRKRLSKVSAADVQSFINTWSETPLAAPLKQRWLRQLAQTNKWQQYLDNYSDQINSAELKCFALWAQHKTGHTEEALSKVPGLWLVGYSQANACDPIFQLWTSRSLLTDDLAWQRFKLAMQQNNLALARHLSGLMSPLHQHLAKLYREIYSHPKRLKKTEQFDLNNPEHREIVSVGFRRLTREDSLLAAELWPSYQQSQQFGASQINSITSHILLWLAHQDNSPAFQKMLLSHPQLVTADILEAGIRLAIRHQDWPLVISLTNQLPEADRSATRAQYWLARAQLETNALPREVILKNLHDVSLQRDYYSFLAADYLRQPYKMNAQQYSLDGNFLERFKLLPAVTRAQELLINGQITEARREWYQVTLNFNEDQHYTAAHYAHQIGWDSQAIRSAISAKRWHDLELRFPLSFEEDFEKIAQLRNLNSNWLIAMARQESALTADAVSPAGARGLIQIMPDTATAVARKHNIAYQSRQQLFDPEKNIELAGAYITSLLERFDGNNIYATAAYNAGPYRVEKWLNTTREMPIDVWIESIPFYETREYVKNVLAYSVIYAHRRHQYGLQMATVNYLPKQNPAAK